MRTARLAMIALVMTAPVLGGCQSIFGGSRSAKIEAQVPEARDPAEFAASQMALGREALEYRQYGLAVIAFRNARLSPEHAAGAYNGLAIAYAQIGRPDLAERFFKEAIARAPGDKRYYANLERFYEAVPASAMRPAREEALAAADPARTGIRFMPGNEARAAIKVERAAQKLVRVSAREVRIATQAPAANDPRRRAPARLGIVVQQPARRLNPDYPVRIRLTPQTNRQYSARPGLARAD